MILLGYNWTSILLGMLYASLALFIIVIAYRKLLRYMDKGRPSSSKFCVLFQLDRNPAKGEITFYFTCEEAVEYSLKILSSDMEELEVVRNGAASPGGNIVRFDSGTLKNGTYYYCLQTEQQRTMKKMEVQN